MREAGQLQRSAESQAHARNATQARRRPNAPQAFADRCAQLLNLRHLELHVLHRVLDSGHLLSLRRCHGLRALDRFLRRAVVVLEERVEAHCVLLQQELHLPDPIDAIVGLLLQLLKLAVLHVERHLRIEDLALLLDELRHVVPISSLIVRALLRNAREQLLCAVELPLTVTPTARLIRRNWRARRPRCFEVDHIVLHRPLIFAIVAQIHCAGGNRLVAPRLRR